MAAVLGARTEALLSHRSAGALLGLCTPHPDLVEVVVPLHRPKRRPGVRAHRCSSRAGARHGAPAGLRDRDPLRWRLVDGIPVTAPAVTLVDVATCLPTGRLEAAINEADHLGLIDPESLRGAIEGLPGRRGVRRLGALLDGPGLTLTATELERLLLPLARDVGLPDPLTQSQLGGHRVDFFWPDLGLVVEADSLRYHRTAFKQSADKRRDNAHARAGRTTLRFTHRQLRHEPAYVRNELRATGRRLQLESERKLLSGQQ